MTNELYLNMSDEQLQREAEELMEKEKAASIEREIPEDPSARPPPEMPASVEEADEQLAERDSELEDKRDHPLSNTPSASRTINWEGMNRMVEILGKILGKEPREPEEE